ncbi:MAG: hypothetical protein SO044_05605 [Agathobaculum sp.]|uniref:hypothetical protein n=1 Tax=Agathobaculum sp. TaxID=2048138 RepID=UPI0025BDBCFA|nr:hypothetical protein [Agathobaculum sp.]MDY3711873.1 hypothetical protein [Agathobaculum sp.]
MRSLQLGLLVFFLVCAALTAFQQLRYGMITGRSAYDDPQSDPAAKDCAKRAAAFAAAAGISLVLCILVGVYTRLGA